MSSIHYINFNQDGGAMMDFTGQKVTVDNTPPPPGPTPPAVKPQPMDFTGQKVTVDNTRPPPGPTPPQRQPMDFTGQIVTVDNTRPPPGPTPPRPTQFEPISEEEKRVGTEIINFIKEFKRVRNMNIRTNVLFTFGNDYVDKLVQLGEVKRINM